jgi:CheY-like chemotaxis protein
MPGLDGFHVLEAMQQELGLTDVPVVLLTASGVFEDALVARGSQIQIRRLDRGLRTQEILGSIKGVLEILSPDYDERHIPVQPLTALA